jgi:hypothetical protein
MARKTGCWQQRREVHVPSVLLLPSVAPARIAGAGRGDLDLPEREKLVVTLYYYEELTLCEIGEVLGVTESRVWQLHTKAIPWARPREPAET